LLKKSPEINVRDLKTGINVHDLKDGMQVYVNDTYTAIVSSAVLLDGSTGEPAQMICCGGVAMKVTFYNHEPLIAHPGEMRSPHVMPLCLK